jgi:hypothetical protein
MSISLERDSPYTTYLVLLRQVVLFPANLNRIVMKRKYPLNVPTPEPPDRS